jgi:predicted ATPase
MSAEELHQRLEHRLPVLTGGPPDAEERQQTLRATIGWSYGLLAEEEQTVFARLAVFRGGCTIAAAEEVADADLNTIGSLLDKSLLVRELRDEPRLSMLQTLREYALERLEELEDGGAVRRRHAETMLEFVRTARGFARGPEAPEWLDRTELELDNIRAALAWTIEVGEGELGLAIAEALEPFWYRRLQLREGLRWLEPLLELTPDAPPRLRGGARGRRPARVGAPGRRARASAL